MSGHDKYTAMEALKAQGWTEAPAAGSYMLRPPQSLTDRLATTPLYVYDARDLQAFVEPAKEPA